MEVSRFWRANYAASTLINERNALFIICGTFHVGCTNIYSYPWSSSCRDHTKWPIHDGLLKYTWSPDLTRHMASPNWRPDWEASNWCASDMRSVDLSLLIIRRGYTAHQLRQENIAVWFQLAPAIRVGSFLLDRVWLDLQIKKMHVFVLGNSAWTVLIVKVMT